MDVNEIQMILLRVVQIKKFDKFRLLLPSHCKHLFQDFSKWEDIFETHYFLISSSVHNLCI